jgi:hypothetical protein
MKGSDRLLKRRCTAIASRLCFNPQIGDEWVSMGGATLLADIVVDFSASVSDKVMCAYILIHIYIYIPPCAALLSLSFCISGWMLEALCTKLKPLALNPKPQTPYPEP